jgi:hypothetical protein
MFHLLLLLATASALSAGSPQVALSATSSQLPSSSSSSDAHSGCVDVSKWGPVTYDDTQCDDCVPRIEKRCEQKHEDVCADLDEIECSIRLQTECKTTYSWSEKHERGVVNLHPAPFFTCEQRMQRIFEYKDGVQYYRTIPITHCVKNLLLEVATCSTRDAIERLAHITCEVNKFPHCKPVKRRECKAVAYEECFDEFFCDPRRNQIPQPHQEQLHLLNCVLDDKNAVPNISAESSAAVVDAFIGSQSPVVDALIGSQ